MFDSAQLTPPSLSPGLLDLSQSDCDFGSSSPPLWPTSPHRTLSPASRTQAILRGQRELMDIVRNMPESSYELSLKDLVDLPRPRLLLEEEKRWSVDGDSDRVAESYGRRGYGYGNRAAARSGSMGKGQQQQEGLMLKMVFPVYPGAAAARGRRAGNRRRQRKEEESSTVEKEWWRKRDGDSEGGDSLYSSTIGGSGKSSGSSSGSSRSNSANSNSNSNSIIAVRHENGGGCWSFLRRKSS